MSTRLSGLFRLFRFELPFAAGICVVLGEFLALGAFPSLRQIGLGFISVFCISATALILKRLLRPGDRSDQRAAPPAALRYGHAAGCGLAVDRCRRHWLAGGLVDQSHGADRRPDLVDRRRAVQLALQTHRHLGQPDGYIFGRDDLHLRRGLPSGSRGTGLFGFSGVIAFLIDLGEEIAGDAMDLEGDRLAGSRSLAVRLGREAALRISAGIFLLVILISSLPFLLGLAGMDLSAAYCPDGYRHPVFHFQAFSR